MAAPVSPLLTPPLPAAIAELPPGVPLAPLMGSMPPASIMVPQPPGLPNQRPIYSEEPLAWSEEAISGDRTLRIPPGAASRLFGQPVDAAAHAEMLAAVGEEAHVAVPDYGVPEPLDPPLPPGIGDSLPAFLTAERGPDSVMVNEPETNDRFAELVYAARNKAIEYEPEAPPPSPPVRTSNKPMFFALLLAFVLAFVLVEHANVVAFFPGSRGFFGLLGLK